MDTPDMHAAFKEARDIAGGNRELAGVMGCSVQNINSLFKRERPCPPKSAIAVETATGVSRYTLRPDVFGVAS